MVYAGKEGSRSRYCETPLTSTVITGDVLSVCISGPRFLGSCHWTASPRVDPDGGGWLRGFLSSMTTLDVKWLLAWLGATPS